LKALVEASSGHDTRTISAPAIAKALICAAVAATSLVGVLVIDCTVIGASPPTSTPPTLILRLRRRTGLSGCCFCMITASRWSEAALIAQWPHRVKSNRRSCPRAGSV
jgi:hypothetical protein